MAGIFSSYSIRITAKTRRDPGEPITAILTNAPGHNTAIGGLKVVVENGWFALRPSGTENIYKIYAKSFIDESHPGYVQDEARAMAAKLL